MGPSASRSGDRPSGRAGRRLGRDPVLERRAVSARDARTRRASPVRSDSAVRQRAAALVVGLETLTLANAPLIVDLAAKHRLPAMYASGEFVGGLAKLATESTTPTTIGTPQRSSTRS